MATGKGIQRREVGRLRGDVGFDIFLANRVKIGGVRISPTPCGRVGDLMSASTACPGICRAEATVKSGDSRLGRELAEAAWDNTRQGCHFSKGISLQADLGRVMKELAKGMAGAVAKSLAADNSGQGTIGGPK